jgi:hypothetical protein
MDVSDNDKISPWDVLGESLFSDSWQYGGASDSIQTVINGKPYVPRA